MLLWHFGLRILSIAVIMLGASVVSGQTYPSQLIRIITGSVGGGSDFVARQIAQGLAPPLGQPAVVENRASIIASETVAKAPPDGYTLLVGGASVWQTPVMQKMNYDPVGDFSPISLISRDVFILAVHPSLPVKSVKELIALANARPGELNYAGGSTGGTTHLAGALLTSVAGVNIVNVPYKGTAPAVAALLSGEVQLAINEAGLITPHVASGKVRALAVTSATPSALVPSLPTVAASGLPGYEWIGMTHLLAPAKTTAAIINRLNQEIVRFINVPEVKERFLKAGSEVVGNSPQEFAAIIKADMVKITKVIKDAGIKFDR